jgi:hypothetical protein
MVPQASRPGLWHHGLRLELRRHGSPHHGPASGGFHRFRLGHTEYGLPISRLAGFRQSRHQVPTSTDQESSQAGDFIKPFTEVPFSLLVVGGFIIFLGGFLPFNYIIVQAREQGMSENLASYLVSIVNAAG